MKKIHKQVASFALAVAFSLSAASANAATSEDAPACDAAHPMTASMESSMQNWSDADLLALSNEQIDEMGLPPRQSLSQGDDTESWLGEVRLPRTHTVPDCISSENVQGYVAGPNWAGYKGVSGSTTGYVAVQGDFVVPSISSGAGCNSSLSSYTGWVGLGGIGVPLIQGGIVYGLGAATPSFFWEYVSPTGGLPVQNVTLPTGQTLSAGDRIHIWVNYLTSSSTMNFGFSNLTKGYSGTITKPVSSAFYNGSTAEWIDERLTVTIPSGTYYSQLYNFGNVAWTNMQVERSNFVWYGLSSQNYAGLVMVNSSSTLAQPNALTTGNNFTDSYVNCQ